MEKQLNERWLSMHIYISGSIDEFLNSTFHRLLRKIEDEFSMFFFIRYFIPSPHIRLRVKTLNSDLVKNMLNEEIICILSNDDYSFSVTSFEFIDYEPEFDRYGGIKTIKIAEKYFNLSSDVALMAFSESPIWNYECAIGHAINLHLSFLFCINLGSITNEKILGLAYHGWLEDFLFLQKGLSRELVEEAFLKSYNRQKSVILQKSRTLLKCLKSGRINKETYLFEWVERSKLLHKELLMSIENKEIDNSFFSESTTKEKIAVLYESIIHMTNNRLGIRNIDESFLAFILLKILNKLNT